MNISELTASDFEDRLKKDGIWFQTGIFSICLKTTITPVVQEVRSLYVDYPLIDSASFADFHISLDHPQNLRRWFKPQVLFLFDGKAPFQPMPADQAFPILEWGLNWCVSTQANDYLIIHAAVIEKQGYTAILPAPPGSGKSTLCAALVCRGWRLLSDELALIRMDDGKIVPLPRPISLKNASIDIIKDYEPTSTFSRKVTDTIKGTVAHMKPPTESVLRAFESAQAAWVVFPKYQSGETTRLEPLSRSRAFIKIADNSFNYSLAGKKGFEVLSGVINHCKCYEFTYSDLDDAVKTFSMLPLPASETSHDSPDSPSTAPAR